MRSIVAFASLVLLLPSAAALPTPAPHDVAQCLASEFYVGDPYACPELARVSAGGETYYAAPYWFYRETNGCEGMQSQPTDCDGDGVVEEADDFYSLYDMTGGRIPETQPAFDAVDAAFDVTYLLVDVADCVSAYQIGVDDADERCKDAIVSADSPTGTYYLQAQPFRLFVETNGCDGLQQAPSDCDGDGEEELSDEELRVL